MIGHLHTRIAVNWYLLAHSGCYRMVVYRMGVGLLVGLMQPHFVHLHPFLTLKSWWLVCVKLFWFDERGKKRNDTDLQLKFRARCKNLAVCSWVEILGTVLKRKMRVMGCVVGSEFSRFHLGAVQEKTKNLSKSYYLWQNDSLLITLRNARDPQQLTVRCVKPI